MYILTDEPASGLRKDAFSALDNAFGTGDFTSGQAETVIANALEEDGSKLFQELLDGDYVSEVGED